jgi:hypothetical protein
MGQIEGSQASRLQKKGMQALKDRTRRRIAGVSPACGCTQPLMRDVYISTAFLFAYRQNAGETPAIRWSRLLFRIADISPVFLQIRRRDACIPGSRASRLHAVVLNR